MITLSKSVQLFATPKLADQLFCATQMIPQYTDAELYNTQLQLNIREKIHAIEPDMFSYLIDEVCKRLSNPPYCAYITGLKFDTYNLLFLSLIGAFGNVVDPYKQPWSRLVYYIRPSTDLKIPGWGVLNEQLHTDGTDWINPNDLTCLLCLKTDQSGGGRTQLLDINTIVYELDRWFGKETIDILSSESLPWLIATELGGGVFRCPILTSKSIRWLPYTNQIALKETQESLSTNLSKAISQIKAVIKNRNNIIDFMMEPNSLLVIDNQRCLHARTPIKHPELSVRLMLRAKVKWRQ
ncbi:MAG: TauD/TfdA family dioxygenase [Hormoscilla sp. GM7CHS1pb]|nr:TauD/TfdA family dioxygenase [Hormoscilla sp. GM7CHS1pb]